MKRRDFLRGLLGAGPALAGVSFLAPVISASRREPPDTSHEEHVRLHQDYMLDVGRYGMMAGTAPDDYYVIR